MRVFVIALLFSINAHAYDFKGIEVGKSSSWESVSNTLLIQCHDKDDGGIWCNGDTTILGNSAEAYVELDAQKIVETISVQFNPSDFESIAESLTKKYGKPKVGKSVLTNAMGANFQQVEMKWSTTNLFMVLKKYGDKLSEGRLWMGTNQFLIEINKSIQKDKSDI